MESVARFFRSPAFSRAFFWTALLWCFFGLLRPDVALSLYWIHDQHCYAVYLYKLLLSPRSFELCPLPFTSPGIAFYWLPFALLAHVPSWITGINFDEWVWPLVGVSSLLTLPLSMLIARRIFKDWTNEQPEFWASVFVISACVIPYMTVFTTFGHAAEFFFAISTIFFLMRRKLGLAFVLASVTAVIRVNDFPLVLMVLLEMGRGYFRSEGPRQTGRYFFWGGALVSTVFAAALSYWFFVKGYSAPDGTFQDLMKLFGWENLLGTLLIFPYALLPTNPWWCACLCVGTIYFPRLTYSSRMAVLWMFALLIICIAWGTNGGLAFHFPFYRYLIGTYVGALVVWHELEGMIPRSVKDLLRILLVVQAAVVLYQCGTYPWMGLYYGPLGTILGALFPASVAAFSKYRKFPHGPVLWTTIALTLSVTLALVYQLRKTLTSSR